MSMNGHAKRTIQTLEALGFERDDDASSRGVNAYRHPNDPDAILKVFSGLSEIAAKKLRNRADQILGMATAGERIPASIGENARIRRAEERAAASAKNAPGQNARRLSHDRTRSVHLRGSRLPLHRGREDRGR